MSEEAFILLIDGLVIAAMAYLFWLWLGDDDDQG